MGAQPRVTITAEAPVKSQEPFPCGANLVSETAESRTGHYLPKSFQPGKESNARLRPTEYSSAPAQGQSQASGPPMVSKPGTTLPSSSLGPDHGDIRPDSSREDPALRKRRHLTWSRGGALEKGCCANLSQSRLGTRAPPRRRVAAAFLVQAPRSPYLHYAAFQVLG